MRLSSSRQLSKTAGRQRHTAGRPSSAADRLRKAALCLLPAGALCFALASCRTSVPPQPTEVEAPRPMPLASLPDFASDPLDDLRTAIAQQCAMNRPPGGWPELCESLLTASVTTPALLRGWLQDRFLARELTDPEAPAGLITGYYEPLLTGSLVRERSDQVPLRGPPADLLTIDLAEIEPRLNGMRLRGRVEGQRVVPYFSREEMSRREAVAQGEATAAAGARPSREVRRSGPVASLGSALAASTAPAPLAPTVPAPAIAWADSAVDAFFLEIQGSGRVRLRDGSVMRVGYADQNGHPYKAIGKTLIERGALKREEVTAPAIRQWLQDNPKLATGVMQTNPSLVFFRQLPPPVDPALGPPGALGVPLTPLRSIAVDRKHIALGSLVYLQTTHPVSGTPINRIMVAQDTGGAIRGIKRADVFWGFGDDAARAAGLMKAPARMWVLEPRQLPAAPRTSLGSGPAGSLSLAPGTDSHRVQTPTRVRSEPVRSP